MEYVVSMLPNTQHVQETYEKNVFPYASKKAIMIDSSTISPIAAMALSDTASKKGLTFVDAPVSGGITAAAAGSLTFMVGAANEELFEVRAWSSMLSNYFCRNARSSSQKWGRISSIAESLALVKSQRYLLATWNNNHLIIIVCRFATIWPWPSK